MIDKITTNSIRMGNDEVVANLTDDSKILAQLAKSSRFEVRQNVARNKKTPVNILSSLKDDIFCVSIIASHPSSTPELLDTIYEANKTETSVLDSLCLNWVTPSTILEKIWEAQLFGTSTKNVLADNPNTPSHILEKMWDSVHGWDRDYLKNYICRNPSASTELVHKMLMQKEHELTQHLISHPNIAPTDFEQIFWTLVEAIKSDDYYTQKYKSPLISKYSFGEAINILCIYANMKNIDCSWFEVLTSIDQTDILNRVLLNKAFGSRPIFEKYATSHRSKDIRYRAVERLRELGDFKDWPDEWIEAHYNLG